MSATVTFSSPVSFFFNDMATTEIYTLSLHDALPISYARGASFVDVNYFDPWLKRIRIENAGTVPAGTRSEEHTSELQSRPHLVCRLLLEKKKMISSLVMVTKTLPTPMH